MNAQATKNTKPTQSGYDEKYKEERVAMLCKPSLTEVIKEINEHHDKYGKNRAGHIDALVLWYQNQGDESAFEKLLGCHQPLIKSLVNKAYGRLQFSFFNWIGRDDLYSMVLEEFNIRVRSYDFSYEYPFSAYVKSHIHWKLIAEENSVRKYEEMFPLTDNISESERTMASRLGRSGRFYPYLSAA